MTSPLPGAMTGMLRVLLADDHVSFREWLGANLDEEPGILVVGHAGDGLAAVRLAEELAADVVVMDVAMPELSGIEATRRITASLPAVKVIALSMHRERAFVEGMLAAGAAGYVLKENAASELASALRAVAAGDTYLCPGLG